MIDHSKAIDALNDLLARNYDAEKGYKQAAEQVEETRLVSWFNSKAQERYDFGHEIKEEIRSLGGTPEKGTTVKGDLHRTWLNVKSALSLDTTEAILEECERGEETFVETYDEALKDTALPASTRSLLIGQRNKAASALARVEQLEETHD
ncbi:MAG: PA2169 family four-helix-bundle protein [Bacteroidota bacterium]